MKVNASERQLPSTVKMRRKARPLRTINNGKNNDVEVGE